MLRPASLTGLTLASTLAALVGCRSGSPSEQSTQSLSVTHSFDLDAHMPAHLAVMFSMSWFGIPNRDPQGPGPDPSYANGGVSFSCTNAQSDPSACDSCILLGAGDVCQATGAPQRQFASRRRPLAGIYSASGRDVEGQRRVALELSAVRRPCDDGAKIDVWAAQIDGTHNTSLHPGHPACASCDIAYHALGAFLAAADAAGMQNVIMPSDDSTWYFHFSSAAGLGLCDDSPGNPKQACVDALTQDFVDLAALADAHPSALRIKGLPVLFTYLDPGQLSAAEWQTLFQNVRDAIGHDFYSVATLQAPQHSEYFGAFDALSPWVQLDWSSTTGSDLRTHAANHTAAKHAALYSALGLYPGRVVFGGISPGFDDFTENWGGCIERQLPPGQPRDPDFLNGEFDYLASQSTAGIILETWDDWTEGTEFEPDVAGGTSMLVALRQHLGALYGEPADPNGDARLDQRWTQYGQARNCNGGSASVPPAISLDCASSGDGGVADLGNTPHDGGTTSDGAIPTTPDGTTVVFLNQSCGCVASGPGPVPLIQLALLLSWLGARIVTRRRRAAGR